TPGSDNDAMPGVQAKRQQHQRGHKQHSHPASLYSILGAQRDEDFPVRARKRQAVKARKRQPFARQPGFAPDEECLKTDPITRNGMLESAEWLANRSLTVAALYGVLP